MQRDNMYKINDTITEEIFVQDSNGDAVTGLVNADFTKEFVVYHFFISFTLLVI